MRIQDLARCLFRFPTQVNVKRNVTRSREGRRKPEARLLNATHWLSLRHVSHRACPLKCAAAAQRHHTRPCLEDDEVWRNSFLPPLSPLHMTISPCCCPCFRTHPLLQPPSVSSTTHEATTHFNKAPRRCRLPQNITDPGAGTPHSAHVPSLLCWFRC